MTDAPQSLPKTMAVRKNRRSKIKIPVGPNVTIIEVETRTEYVDGRPVVKFFLPTGSTISNEPQQSPTAPKCIQAVDTRPSSDTISGS